MGDDTPIEVVGEGRVELPNGSFENVLHVPNISINILSVYQITQIGKMVEFTSDSVTVLDMHDNSIIVVGEVYHKSRLYNFTKFILDDSSLLLTHANDSSRVWHERFGHLNFRYMQRLSKQGMVKGLSDIQFSEGVCEGCILGKHLEEKFEKGKARRASSSLELVHNDLMGPFPVGPWLWKYAKIKEEKGECELHGRHSDYYWVEVSKREEKTERSKSLNEEIRDDKIRKKEGSWTTQQVGKATVGCFGAPCEKEGKTGWQSPENMGQVDLGF
jgi:hypothetical protein